MPARDWSITVVDQDDAHLYQPGLLLLPFGVYTPDELVKPRRRFLPSGVDLVVAEIERVDADANEVHLADGRTLGYDYLVVATGTSPRPDQTPGMAEGEWRRSVFDFYTLDGATALRDELAGWPGGRIVVHVTEMPIKCPVAPLEFTFLADAFFEERGMRDKVEITYVTPLEGAFTKPVASKLLGSMLAERHIALEGDFVVDRIDPGAKTLVSMDEREVPFDLLVTVPLNMGADFVGRSGLGDELNYVPVDRATFLSKAHDNVFAIGDASDLPVSKAGSVAHFSVEIFVENFVEYVAGKPMAHAFDGHANCFIESGHGQRPAYRLQLRHRAASRQIPDSRRRSVHAAGGVAGEPSRQTRLPLGVLAPAAQGPADAGADVDVDGRQARRDLTTAPPEGGLPCLSPRSMATTCTSTPRAS